MPGAHFIDIVVGGGRLAVLRSKELREGTPENTAGKHRNVAKKSKDIGGCNQERGRGEITEGFVKGQRKRNASNEISEEVVLSLAKAVATWGKESARDVDSETDRRRRAGFFEGGRPKPHKLAKHRPNQPSPLTHLDPLG